MRLLLALTTTLVAGAGALLAACGGGDGTTPATQTPAASRTAAPSATPRPPDTSAPGPSPAVATSTPATVASPTPAPPGPPAIAIYRGSPDRRVIALTFDAGADAGFTAQILATLRAERIRASFGVTGRWAEENVPLLAAIAADGHEFINHTYSHRSFTGRSTGTPPLTYDERALELARTERTVYRLTGRSTLPYFRPPFGDLDDSVLADAGREGYRYAVMWTVDTLGWDGLAAAAIVQRGLALAEPGAIYIMHVGSESQDAAALPALIAGLRAAGYGFVPVSELIAAA